LKSCPILGQPIADAAHRLDRRGPELAIELVLELGLGEDLPWPVHERVKDGELPAREANRLASPFDDHCRGLKRNVVPGKDRRGPPGGAAD
jgi:hypothetical protein